MELTIVIVNYNVRHFLENCLRSVLKATEGLVAEVIVVDNASTDDSPAMMRSRFPQVEYIYLNENVGFSKANNLAMRKARGNYVLLLNPDTVVREDTFSKCLAYMEAHPNVGGLGVRMVDGHGRFLPESKRGLPTPAVAFFKIFGLAALFPKSKTFGRYHLGYLDEHQCHTVEVLSGAFMFMRKTTLDKVGLLDEEYFMYGEDIDLSYRILKGGFENHYFPETGIIHYKGESTKKGSLNYVFVFYRAMVIFARKHFERGQASLFSLMINIAIYFRALLALVSRIVGRFWQFLVDFLVIYASFALATNFYEDFGHKDFSLPFIALLLPLYSFILAAVLHFSGAHDSPFKPVRLLRGWVIGVLMLLAVYALLGEDHRFSRAVVLLGALVSLTAGYAWRWMASALPQSGFETDPQRTKRRLVVGNEASLTTVKRLLDECGLPNTFIAGLSTDGSRPQGFIATVGDTDKAVKEFRVDEVVVDCAVAGYGTALNLMEQLGGKAQLKLLNGDWMIGPNKVVEAHRFKSGNDINTVNTQAMKRNKRWFDIVFCGVALALSPVLVFLVDRKAGFFANIAAVAVGRKSWVGYDPRGKDRALPALKPAPIHPMMDMILPENMAEQAFDNNVNYLKAAPLITDAQLVLQHLHHLGN